MNWKTKATMDEIESEAQLFIVRVWVEEYAEGGRVFGAAISLTCPVADAAT
jgi:hypothetical protein